MSGYEKPPTGPYSQGPPPPMQPQRPPPPQQQQQQYPPPQQQYPPRQQAYPPPQQQPPRDPIADYFYSVAGRDQTICADELRRALSASGIGAYPRPDDQFSMETCRLMIAMLDADHSGNMGLSEFRELWTAISQWKQTFQKYDEDRSGTIETRELHKAISAYGYNLKESTVASVTNRYSRYNNGQIMFDDFMAISVKLRAVSERFRAHDREGNGWATMHYEDFILMTLTM